MCCFVNSCNAKMYWWLLCNLLDSCLLLVMLQDYIGNTCLITLWCLILGLSCIVILRTYLTKIQSYVPYSVELFSPGEALITATSTVTLFNVLLSCLDFVNNLSPFLLAVLCGKIIDLAVELCSFVSNPRWSLTFCLQTLYVSLWLFLLIWSVCDCRSIKSNYSALIAAKGTIYFPNSS